MIEISGLPIQKVFSHLVPRDTCLQTLRNSLPSWQSQLLLVVPPGSNRSSPEGRIFESKLLKLDDLSCSSKDLTAIDLVYPIRLPSTFPSHLQKADRSKHVHKVYTQVSCSRDRRHLLLIEQPSPLHSNPILHLVSFRWLAYTKVYLQQWNWDHSKFLSILNWILTLKCILTAN